MDPKPRLEHMDILFLYRYYFLPFCTFADIISPWFARVVLDRR